MGNGQGSTSEPLTILDPSWLHMDYSYEGMPSQIQSQNNGKVSQPNITVLLIPLVGFEYDLLTITWFQLRLRKSNHFEPKNSD